MTSNLGIPSVAKALKRKQKAILAARRKEAQKKMERYNT